MAKKSIMRAVGGVARAMVVAVAVVGYSDAASAAGADPMRCEALKLRCDSRYHMCLSRCDGVADRRSVRSPENAEAVRTRCSDSCDMRHERMEQRLKERRVCKGHGPEPVPTPNPQTCAAELLWVKANFIQCMGRCHARLDQRPAFDCDDCLSRCYDEYRADTKGANEEPICAEGPVETVPEEGEPAPCTPTE